MDQNDNGTLNRKHRRVLAIVWQLQYCSVRSPPVIIIISLSPPKEKKRDGDSSTLNMSETGEGERDVAYGFF